VASVILAEEAPAAGRALLEQVVHLRRQPDRGDTGGNLRLAARRGAVEAEYATMSRVMPGARLRRAGADIHLTLHRFEAAGDRPAPGTAAPWQIGIARPAQAPTRHQKRDRLQQIGLAVAVRPEQSADPRGGPPGEGRVVAEIGKREAAQAHAPMCGRDTGHVNL
jgi:hypothetical protein